MPFVYDIFHHKGETIHDKTQKYIHHNLYFFLALFENIDIVSIFLELQVFVSMIEF